MKPDRNAGYVLPYESAEYIAHKGVIANLTQRAETMRLLRDQFYGKIFGAKGIMCERPRDDKEPSVSRSFYGLSINPHSNHLHRLLQDVVATHLSIQDPMSLECDADAVVNAYRELIDELEQFSEEHDIPSVFPNLFSPASLSARLRAPEFDTNLPMRREFFDKLASMFINHDKYLHAVVTMLDRQHGGNHELAWQCVQSAAQQTDRTVQELCQRNPLLLDSISCMLFDMNQKAELIALCESFTPEFVARLNDGSQKYIRALLDTDQLEKALEFIQSQHPNFPKNDRHLERTLGIAMSDIGWLMYGQGRYAEAKALLEAITPWEISDTRSGREDLQGIYKAVCDALKE